MQHFAKYIYFCLQYYASYYIFALLKRCKVI
nr:MAG TPA: hypothetical protein [Caudoviricetes sp.]